MMMLPSSGGLRSPRLRSPKSFRTISSSREVSGKASSSHEERSKTGNPSEGSLCSYGVDGGSRKETSGEEVSGGEDLVGDGSGEALLEEDEDPLASARERLVPLLFSIVDKWGKKEKIQSEK
jgi:hypothetical protein